MSPAKSRGDALARLAHELRCDGSFVAELEMAVSRPKAYLRENAKSLRRRGVASGYPPDDLPRLALIHGLVERGRAVEIDWRSDFDELEGAFASVSPRPPIRAWREVRARALDAPIAEVLVELTRSLAASRNALCELVGDTDSHVVLVVRREKLDEISSLAKHAGVTLHEYRRRAESRSARRGPGREAARGSWSAFLSRHGATNTHGLLLRLAGEPRLLLEEAREMIEKAPKSDRETVRTLVDILENGADVDLESRDPMVVLEAVPYLTVSDGTADFVFPILVGVIRRHGLTSPRAHQAQRIVRACAFPLDPDLGRASFLALPEEDKRLLRAIVVKALRSKRPEAAADAAKVVGDAALIPTLTKLAKSGTPLVRSKMRSAVAYLRLARP